MYAKSFKASEKVAWEKGRLTKKQKIKKVKGKVIYNLAKICVYQREKKS